MPQLDCRSLKQWFLQEQRDLPWRQNRSPYSVWVSEMMLQQTQVAVVIPYYLRWMERFPTVQDLAKAALDDVIKIWEGLGYYSRARYLHEGARYLMQHCNGVFPNNPEAISNIKGIGHYTVGAICSFAFNQRIAAVDGNVIRVLARYFALQEDIAKPKTVSMIRELASQLLPEEEPWVINEALIELGAVICTRTPQCHKCPLRKSCQGYKTNLATTLPIKSKKIEITSLHRIVTIIKWQNKLLVKRCPEGEIMSGLHEFPYFEAATKISHKQVEQQIQKQFNLKTKWQGKLQQQTHSFTRYRVRLTPLTFTCESDTQPSVKGHQWLSDKEMQQLAFSSGHRKILNNIAQETVIQ